MPDSPGQDNALPRHDTTQPRSCAGGAVTGYGFDPKTGREFPCDKDGNEVAGGADLWAIREDLAHIVQQLDAMVANKSGSGAVSEAEVEAAAKQLHHEFGCTITAARIAAVRALDAATKVREGK